MFPLASRSLFYAIKEQQFLIFPLTMLSTKYLQSFPSYRCSIIVSSWHTKDTLNGENELVVTDCYEFGGSRQDIALGERIKRSGCFIGSNSVKRKQKERNYKLSWKYASDRNRSNDYIIIQVTTSYVRVHMFSKFSSHSYVEWQTDLGTWMGKWNRLLE